MNVTISPTRLAELRVARKLSQARLAKKASVGKRQLQRIESAGGDTYRVRETTLRRLATALAVEQKVLSGDQPIPGTISTRGGGESNVKQTTVRMDARTVLNYDLVQERYGASFKDLINLAPLLFVLHAEKAMKIKEQWVRDRLEDADAEDYEDDDLLLNPGEGDDTRLLQSVEIFGTVRRAELEFLEPNPFVEHLIGEIRALDDSMRARLSYWAGDALGQLMYHPGDRVPETEVCRHELTDITCRDPAATLALTCGQVRVRDIPTELMRTDMGIERITWLRRAPGAVSPVSTASDAEGDVS